MSEIKNDNFLVIQGWMVNDLQLKGNELLVYACIYGFSQKEGQTYHGGLSYLTEWTNTSKRNVLTCLQNLVAKGYLKKVDETINGVKVNHYVADMSEFSPVVKNFHWGGEKNSLGGGEKFSPNNIYNKQENLKEKENKYNVEIAEIIDYLNEKLGTEYRAKSRVNRECITARLNEGFTVDDFKKVIDNKYEDWGGTDMELYLRPQTLFGTKFETYLNASTDKRKSKITKPTMGIWLG